MAATIQSDALFTKDLKEKTDQAVQDTIIATRIVDGFKNPQQHGIYLKNHASFPLEYAFGVQATTRATDNSHIDSLRVRQNRCRNDCNGTRIRLM